MATNTLLASHRDSKGYSASHFHKCKKGVELSHTTSLTLELTLVYHLVHRRPLVTASTFHQVWHGRALSVVYLTSRDKLSPALQSSSFELAAVLQTAYRYMKY